ncbi:MAG: DUF7507 domain-containing protein [Aquaticitalea sp.]
MDKSTYPYLANARLFTRKKLILFSFAVSFVLFSWSSNIYETLSNYFFAPVAVPCNTDVPVPLTNLNYTNLDVTSNTLGLCILGCGIQNSQRIVDANEDNFATVNTLLGLGVVHNIRVTDNTVGEFYTAGNYAGFLIRNTSVLQADLLSAIEVRTYLDGDDQESHTGTSLAVVNTTLLGSDRYYVGFYTNEDFDAVQISISSLAGILSSTNIFHAVTDSFCEGPALECNTPTPLARPEFPASISEERTGFGGLLGVGSITDVDNAVDSDSDSYANINFTLGLLATGNLAIKDELTDYEANTYVGFDIENTSVLNLNIINGTSIRTYLNGTLQETKSGISELISVDSGLLLTGTERSQVGFVTTLPFDEVQLSIQQTLSLNLGSTRVYGLVLEAFCEGNLECNSTVLSNPSQPVIINNTRTGVDGIACVGCEVDNATNVISESNSDFAMINVVAGVASTASISVENALSTFPAGSSAGFIIRDTNDLLQVDLLSSLTITTYLDDAVQETQTAGDLIGLQALGLINITPTDSNSFYLVGFETTLEYDEIRLTVAGLVGVINSLEVYGSYVDHSIKIDGTVINELTADASDGSISVSVSGGTPPYEYIWSPGGQITSSIDNLAPGAYSVTVTDANGCEATEEFIVYTDGPQNPIPCNTDEPFAITALDITDLTVSTNTTGLCVLGCGISNEDNIIDSDESNYATVSTVIGVGVNHSLTVADETNAEFFTAGGYAGFLIENTSILQADLLNAITVRTLLDGDIQETNSGATLAVVNTSLLGTSQYYVGFYTTANYDAIQITISSLAGVLSTTNVYHAVTNSFCVGPDLECNTPTPLAKPAFPARIVDEHTGFGGVLGVGSITDASNAVDSNSNSYASIDFILGVLTTGNLAIKDELTDYEANTYVGFDIENSSVLDLDIIGAVTIKTYLNGTLQETKSGISELISVDSGLLLTGTERSQVGFVTTLPFDEVQLSIQQTVGLNLGTTRIFGLVLEAFCEGELDCSMATVLSNPSHPVIINNIRTGIDGVACVGCEVDNTTNVISESASDFAMINVVAGVASTASISVENVLSIFPAGSGAGFVIRDTNDLLQVDLLNSLTITTYLDGSIQETQSGGNLLGLQALGLINITPTSSNGFYLVGFITTEDYDELRLTVAGLVGVINSIEVYGSYVDSSIQIEATVINETAIDAMDGSLSVTVTGGTPPYQYLWSPGGETTSSIGELSPGLYTVTVTDANGCEATAEFIVYTDGIQYPVPCNTDEPIAITEVGFTDLTINESTSGTCVVGCGILNEENIIDADENNFATVATLVGLGVTHTLQVTDETSGEFFTAGGYAGFLIRNGTILQADLLESINVRTLLDGDQQEVSTVGTLVTLNSTLLGSDAYYVGFYTTTDYDAIEISISSLTGVLSTTDVFYAVTSSFCAGPQLDCNTPTQLTKPEFPVRIVEEHTGLGGVLGVGSVNNTNNVIDSNLGNYASIDLLAGVVATGSIAVKDEVTDYPEMTYAGFDIENATLVNTQLFDAITISTYLDGTLVESRTGTTELLPVSTGLLFPGTESVRVGFVTTSTFDEVRLTVSQLVSLNLGTTRVYGMVLEAFCEGTISCDAPYVLANPIDPVIINNGRTGIDGVACVACEVDDTQNVISADISDYALINVVAGVASTASISVKDVLTDYPVGTVAGFVIRDTNDLLEVDLLNSITITTYLDDVQQEQRTAANLLALEALGLINITPTSTDNFYVVAFATTFTFDEVQITAGALAGVVNSLEVYGTYIDATTTGLCQNADIVLVKTGVFNDGNGDNCSDAGETITYSFTVTNEGNTTITNVILNDPMLGGDIALESGDADADGELDVEEIWIYTADYTISQDDIDVGFVINQATVTGTDIDGMEVNDLSDDDSILEDDVTETTLCQSTSTIALIKTGVFNDGNGDNCSDAGETITYSFTVTNEGNTTITNVILNDPMLGGDIALESGDADADGELDVEEIWIYTADYTITQNDIDAGFVINQATVTGTDIDGMEVNDFSDDDSILEDDRTETTLCQSTPTIALIKTGVFNDGNGDNCSDAGETITYSFTVTNEGNTTITNVILNDPMLGGDIALESGDADADGELDVEEIWIYTADYTITQDDIDVGFVINQATVTGTDIDGMEVNDLSDDDSILEDDVTETTLCQPNETAAIAVIKTGMFNDGDGDGCSDVGETVTYTFTVTNEGTAPITNIVLNDPMLGGDITLASGDTNTNGELDIDESWIYNADYAITQVDIDAGVVNNQATVTGVGNGTSVSDLSDDNSVLEDDATETTLCQPNGTVSIAVIKTGTFNDGDGDGCSDVDETITYTFTVTNEGNTPISNVVLNDPMLGGDITLASGDTDSDNELDIDEVWIYSYDYSITQADIDAGLVSNQATVTGMFNSTTVTDLSDDDSVLEDDITQTTLCQPNNMAAIAVIKTGVFNDRDGDGCSDVGETITYTFTVTNEGSFDIASVVLNDPLLGGDIALSLGDSNSNNILEVNETWIYTDNYTVTRSDIDSGAVNNQATVIGVSNGVNLADLSDDDSVIEDDVTVTPLCNTGSISLEKVGVFNDENADGSTQIGETISYSFVVYNTGSVTLYGISIQDELSGIIMSGGPMVELGPGEVDSTTFTAIYIITEEDLNTMTVTNQAIVTATDPSGNTVNDTSDDPTDLTDIDINGDGEPDDPTITVLPAVGGREFEIFNAVSPDGDNQNDFFRIVGIEDYPNNNLKIFNRWGVLLYEMDGYGIDGKVFTGVSDGRVTVSKNEELPTGTYFYVLRRFISGGETLTDEGYLYIKRN